MWCHLHGTSKMQAEDHSEESHGEGFDDEEEDEIFETMDDMPMKIVPGLYLGSFMAEQNIERLKEEGVTHLLCVADGMEPSHPDEFKYMQVLVQDRSSVDLVIHFQKCFDFMDEAIAGGGAVLVHCAAGVSRSAAVVIGYLMRTQKRSYDEAFRHVHAIRPWVMPNSGFQMQLEEYERIGCDLSKWTAWQNPTIDKDDPFT